MMRLATITGTIVSNTRSLLVVFCCLVCWVNFSAAYQISVATTTANPSTTASIPVMLDNAAGVASLSLQINYDPQIIEVLSVTASDLGELFILDSNIDDGRLRLTLVREDALTSGGGVLVYINVRVNDGAVPGNFTDLKVANLGLGALYGADLARTSQVSLTSGGLWIVNSGTLDSVGDGILDSWRAQYFPNVDPTGTTTNHLSCATCDASGTGQNNLFKYIAGLDPTNSASVFELTVADVAGQPVQKLLTFRPWAAGRTYTPQYRTNLVTGSYGTLAGYSGLQTNVDAVTLTDTNAIEPQKFYRIKISYP